MEIRKTAKKAKKFENERVKIFDKRKWEGIERETGKEGEIMFCWQILILSCVGVKCVVFAKNQLWLSREVFVSVADRGFVVVCGRGLKKHSPSFLSGFFSQLGALETSCSLNTTLTHNIIAFKVAVQTC